MTAQSKSSTSKPRLLDLFCGAGGCTKGYQRAGFYVVGIDLEPQPNYCGDEFIQGDALEASLEGFDAVHASPPCPAHSFATSFHPGARENHPDLIPVTRAKLQASGLPYVIENVPGAPLRKDVVLCGEMFGLRVHRHRIFETGGFFVMQPRHAPHTLKGALTNCHIEEGHARLVAGNYADHEDAADAMGIDWPMSRRELANAIPPAYTEHVGGFLMQQIEGDYWDDFGRVPGWRNEEAA